MKKKKIMDTTNEKLSWLGETFVNSQGKIIRLEELSTVKLILLFYLISWCEESYSLKTLLKPSMKTGIKIKKK